MGRSLPVSDIATLAQSGIASIPPGDVELLTVPNVSRYTEDMSWAYWGAQNTMTKGATKQALIDGRLVTLGRLTSSNFYAISSLILGTAGLTPFKTGRKYLVSFYVYSDKDMWFIPRALSGGGDYGHGVKWSRAGTVSRVWYVAVATSTSKLDPGINPTVALGSGTGYDPCVIQQNSNQALDVYIGGTQIECISSSAKDGVAYIGDSTFAGSAGSTDTCRDFNDPNLREVSTVLGALLNVPVFNRAIGGNKLTDMDTRFATDITPMASRSAYCVIQGGINDIANGATLAQCQAPLISMTAKAIAAGMTCRYVTCSPTASISATPAFEAVRQAYSAWLISTYGSAVSDIDSILKDPENPSLLRPEYWGDGTHYPGNAKTSVAKYMYKTLDWSAFPKPSQYSRVQS